MCGRFITCDKNGVEGIITALPEKAKKLSREAMGDYIAYGSDAYPSATVPILTLDCLFPAKWGFAKNKGGLIFNARSEGMNENRFFKNMARCAVPATAYYEWRHEGENNDKYRISMRDTKLLFFAGVCGEQNGTVAFAVVTRQASDEIAFIHPRMPLIIQSGFVSKWIKYGDCGSFSVSAEYERV